MAIQNRRGAYTNFDPQKLVEGEWAVIKSGDPNSTSGRSVYMCFESGVVKRMSTFEDMENDINSVTSEIQESLTESVADALSGENGIETRMTAIESDYADLKLDNTTQLNSMQGQVTTALSGENGIETRMTAIESDYVDLKNDNADDLANIQSQVTDAISDVNSAIADADAATENANGAASQVASIIAQGGLVASVFGRSGAVEAEAGDYNVEQIAYDDNKTLAEKLSDMETYDNVPLAGSTRPVKSGGIYSALTDVLYAGDSATPTGEVDFSSQDTTLTPTSSVSVELLSASDAWSARLYKISQMFKNIRYLLKMLGTTSISSIGGGTVTGAINTLNSNMTGIETADNSTAGLTIRLYYQKSCPNIMLLKITGETTSQLSTAAGFANFWNANSFITAACGARSAGIIKYFVNGAYKIQLQIESGGLIKIGYATKISDNTATDIPSGTNFYVEEIIFFK